MSKKFVIGLNSKDIEKTLLALSLYKRQLNYNILRYLRELDRAGEGKIRYEIACSQGDADPNIQYQLDIGFVAHGLYKATISVSGKDILFFEFGSGWHYNRMSAPHPLAAKFHYGPGTYPGQTHVKNMPMPINSKGHPIDYWYYGSKENAKRSYGQEGRFGVYKGALAIKASVMRIARMVF